MEGYNDLFLLLLCEHIMRGAQYPIFAGHLRERCRYGKRCQYALNRNHWQIFETGGSNIGCENYNCTICSYILSLGHAIWNPIEVSDQQWITLRKKFFITLFSFLDLNKMTTTACHFQTTWQPEWYSWTIGQLWQVSDISRTGINATETICAIFNIRIEYTNASLVRTVSNFSNSAAEPPSALTLDRLVGISTVLPVEIPPGDLNSKLFHCVATAMKKTINERLPAARYQYIQDYYTTSRRQLTFIRGRWSFCDPTASCCSYRQGRQSFLKMYVQQADATHNGIIRGAGNTKDYSLNRSVCSSKQCPLTVLIGEFDSMMNPLTQWENTRSETKNLTGIMDSSSRTGRANGRLNPVYRIKDLIALCATWIEGMVLISSSNGTDALLPLTRKNRPERSASTSLTAARPEKKK